MYLKTVCLFNEVKNAKFWQLPHHILSFEIVLKLL